MLLLKYHIKTHLRVWVILMCNCSHDGSKIFWTLPVCWVLAFRWWVVWTCKLARFKLYPIGSRYWYCCNMVSAYRCQTANCQCIFNGVKYSPGIALKLWQYFVPNNHLDHISCLKSLWFTVPSTHLLTRTFWKICFGIQECPFEFLQVERRRHCLLSDYE